MKILTAKYVLPISTPPIENGAVAIQGTEIRAVGKLDEIIDRIPAAQVEDFGQAAILPGFVNCHSHLEITAMRGALDDVENDFAAWLLKLNAIRASFSESDIRLSALAGAAEGAVAGVTCFGDIGRYGVAGLEALKTVGLRGVVYQETEFCVDSRTAKEDCDALFRKFWGLRGNRTDLVDVGLSPHSTYTVGPRQLELIAEFALANEVKVSIHTAESMAEDNLLRRGLGFFTEIYRKYDVVWKSPFSTSIEYLDRLGVLATKPLLAHCVTVSENDIEMIVRSDSAIAHCPRSNAKFGHGSAPLSQFLHAGISVGLGSDSVASNNSCDLLAEASFAALAARNRPGDEKFISAREILAVSTMGGARALGLDGQIGSLEPGKQADIAVIDLSHIAQQPVHDVHTALVFASNARDVSMTMVAGEVVYSNDALTRVDMERLSRLVNDLTAAIGPGK